MRFFQGNIFWILALSFIPISVFAWNEDFAAPSPGNRSVCIKNLANLWKGIPVNVRSTSIDEICEKEETRYQWVVGKEPKGSMALLPKKTMENTYPPWVPSWPSSENSGSPRIWHFTCVGNIDKEILGTSMKVYTFKGEITAPVKYQSCESAYVMAQGVCVNQLGGMELYEQCSGGSNYLIEKP